MKHIFVILSLSVVLSVFVLPVALTAQTFAGSTVTITSDGATTVGGAQVMQIAGSTLYTRLYWGQSFVRVLVKTTGDTKFYRGTGESTTLSEVSVGDLLNITGQLQSGSDSLVLLATTIKNSSVQKEQTSVSGTVTTVDLPSGNFTLNSKTLGAITVATSAATTFTKGNRTLDLAHVQVGDTIIKVTGDYNLTTKTLVATSVTTYVNMAMYQPQNYQGTLVSVAGTSLPTSVQVSVGNTTYTVMLTQTTSVLTNNKKSALLARYIPGDTVRLYGAIREQDAPVIDASILRDLNL